MGYNSKGNRESQVAFTAGLNEVAPAFQEYAVSLFHSIRIGGKKTP